MSRNTKRYRLDVEIVLLCGVERNLIGVVVVARVRGLYVWLIATFVVAFARLAAMSMLVAVGVARYSNSRIAAYP